MGKREKLEQYQVFVYAVALAVGIAIGWGDGALGRAMEAWINPLLAVLLYGMFTLIPFLKLREALKNGRFVAGLLLTNFVGVPLVVWGLLTLFPQPEAVAVGVCLVLLAPCIDYVIVFTALGRGDEKAMTAATPLLFVAQVALLPIYLRLFAGTESARLFAAGPFVQAFLTLIVLPLVAALLTQLWARPSEEAGEAGSGGDQAREGIEAAGIGKRQRVTEAEERGKQKNPAGNAPDSDFGPRENLREEPKARAGGLGFGARLLAAAAWIPVPFMAMVLIAVTASQIGRILADPAAVLRVLPLYALFLLIMPPLARLIGRLLRLDAGSGRALIFSAFTRNSLVVLPLALALPGEAADIAAAVIVTQTITELIGELIYVRAVPGLLWRDRTDAAEEPPAERTLG